MALIEKQITELKSLEDGNSFEAENLQEIIRQDLVKYLGSEQERGRKLHFLSFKTELNKRTLNRILNRENRASYATVLRLYRFLLNTEDDQQVMVKAPPAVSKFLAESYPATSASIQNKESTSCKLLEENSVALAIYILALARDLTVDRIQSQFGIYGVNLFQKLVAEKWIREVTPGKYTEGSKKVDFSPEMVFKAGLVSTEAFGKPKDGYEIGRHFAGFFAEKISLKCFQEWQRIDHESFKQKVAVAEQCREERSIPAFTFSISETTNLEGNSDDKL